MSDITYCKATIKDIPFIVETIIEAEKSGTDRLSYSTIFGLNEEEVKFYLSEMLMEEADGCGELSLSSYIIAKEKNNFIAASSAWIEGAEGMPTSILKGNLLNFVLPKKTMEKALKLQPMLNDLHFDYKSNSIFMGAGYVRNEYRGNNMLMILKKKNIDFILNKNPEIKEAYVDIFSCNTPAIRTNEKMGFKIIKTKQSNNNDILDYLPSNKKLLLKKELI